MDAQVEHFTLKRRSEPMAGAPPKKECLMVARRRAAAAFNQELNATLQNQDVAACLALQPDSLVSGPCNCVKCSSKTSVTVPQVRFDKKRRDGHIETTSLYKEYRLVMHKRWALPGQTKTWPFGYKLWRFDHVLILNALKRANFMWQCVDDVILSVLEHAFNVLKHVFFNKRRHLINDDWSSQFSLSRCRLVGHISYKRAPRNKALINFCLAHSQHVFW